MMLIFLSIFTTMFMLMMIFNLISMKSFKDQEKASPFECGFEPKNSSRMTFSINFFLIALMFLIFDIEFSLLIPLIYININFINFMMISIFIILFLMMSLYYEWSQKALNWLM
uniref:NADH-ubiquinone oxidoreductase chain 3 n=1 Tax=Syrbatus sp. 3 RRMO-2024a TaxID=3154169 RepID=A0AAU7LKS2_9COLE